MENKPASLLVESHLTGFPYLGEVDRWLATAERARIEH